MSAVPDPIPAWSEPGTPNLADYQAWLYNVVMIPAANLPITYSIVPFTLQMAVEIVNDWLDCGTFGQWPCACQPQAVYPTIYVVAVYSLGADRLINYAIDIPGQTYFQDLRQRYRINEVSVGVPSAASDQGTSTGILNPEQMRLFTLQDLQTLKTPPGRQYMAYAQMYGRNLWGLS